MTISTTPIQLELHPVVNGRTWHLYGVEFKTAEGTFGTYVYALSDEHAAHIVQELRETATLSGRVEGWARA